MFTAQEGATYTVTLDWFGEFPPDSLYVGAPDGLLETFAWASNVVMDLEPELSCNDLFGRGIAYADAVLYTYWYGADTDDAACEAIYPADEVGAYWDSGRTGQLTVEGTVPFDGTYLIGVGSFDPGTYELTLER
jgi:hypothetical protein